MSANLDFKDLLKSLVDCQVKFLIVGGYAVMHYGEPRFTKDLDIWIEASGENAGRVFKALLKFGAPLAGLTEKDFCEEGYFYKLGVPPVRVDILMSIPGVSFNAAWEGREKAEFNNVDVYFISKKDLITSKRASGRPQDIIDANLLEKAKS